MREWISKAGLVFGYVWEEKLGKLLRRHGPKIKGVEAGKGDNVR